MARQYRSRPSALLHVSDVDPYAAYCFDEVVYVFGTYVEAQLNDAEKGARSDKQRSNKRMMRLQTLLREDTEEKKIVQKEATKTQGAKKTEEKSPADLPAVRQAPAKFRDPADMFKKGKTAAKAE